MTRKTTAAAEAARPSGEGRPATTPKYLWTGMSAAASDAVYTALTAAHSARDLTKACSSTTIIAGWVGELCGVAQLEGLNSGLHRCFFVEIEALEQ